MLPYYCSELTFVCRVPIIDINPDNTETGMPIHNHYISMAADTWLPKPPVVASLIKEVNPGLAKRPLKIDGGLANRWLTSLVKEATAITGQTLHGTRAFIFQIKRTLFPSGLFCWWDVIQFPAKITWFGYP